MLSRKILIVPLCLISYFTVGIFGTFDEVAYRSVQEDATCTLPELVTKYGYPIETYIVQTADGYLLKLYRIPFGRKCSHPNIDRQPVLLQHGLFSSAFDFLILGPESSLGYILADNCYDVWLGNNRGNGQSKSHVYLSTTNPKFWDFSFHEMGYYDDPACIDFILCKTNHSKLHYMGHSQGTTQFFVFGALHPEYHHKIHTMHALSPVAYMKHMKSPLVIVLSLFNKAIEGFSNLIGAHEFVPNKEFLHIIGSNLCTEKFPNLQKMCSNVMFLLCGYDEPQVNTTILPAILGHTPAGASVKQVIHYGQSFLSGKFRQYDHGLIKNMKKYQSFSPPDYDLTKINIPIALYYSSNDWLASLEDVRALEKQLPYVIESYNVPYSKFNHLDFIYAKDVKSLCYDRVLQVLSKYK